MKFVAQSIALLRTKDCMKASKLRKAYTLFYFSQF